MLFEKWIIFQKMLMPKQTERLSKNDNYILSVIKVIDSEIQNMIATIIITFQ